MKASSIFFQSPLPSPGVELTSDEAVIYNCGCEIIKKLFDAVAESIFGLIQNSRGIQK